jgi:short-subunit dehydrogenase
VITGGSSGIGLEVGRLLARRGGWRILLAARDSERLTDAAVEIGGRAVACDVRRDADVAELAHAAAATGGCDLLVQCAGASAGSSLATADADDYRRTLELNLLGLVRVLGAHWPQLVARGGRVVNVCSVAGSVPLERSAPYACSKHAALAWSRALVAPARAQGVIVTSACPGPVPTPGFPQPGIVRHPLGRLLLIDAARCARGMLDASDRGRPEVVLPRRYRLPIAIQGVAPGLVARVLAHPRAPRVGSGAPGTL